MLSDWSTTLPEVCGVITFSIFKTSDATPDDSGVVVFETTQAVVNTVDENFISTYSLTFVGKVGIYLSESIDFTV